MKELGRDQMNLGVFGQIVQFFWSGGAVKSLFPFFVVVLLGLLAFTVWLPPLLTFAAFLMVSIPTLLYLMKLLPVKPELFQDGKIWLGFTKYLQGSKDKGLTEFSPEAPLLQPVSQSAVTSSKSKPQVVEVKP